MQWFSTARPNRNACVRVHAFHLHRLCTHVLVIWRGTVSLRAAGRSRGLRDDGFLFALPNDRSDYGQVLVAGREHEAGAPSRNPLVSSRGASKRPSRGFITPIVNLLEVSLQHRRCFSDRFFVCCLGSLAILIPWLGQDFFPASTAALSNFICARRPECA